MPRLAIFTTHPIQYQAPWFRALSAESDVDLEVIFSYVPDATEQGIGFGQAIQWDIPLREGYRSRVLSSRMLPGRLPAFARRVVGGIGSALDEVKPDAAMVLGWQELSLVGAVLACKRRKIPIILRGESNARRRRSVFVANLHRHYFQFFDAFLAIGSSNAELYRRSGVHPDKIIIANYFVDNLRFKRSADKLRSDRAGIRAALHIPATAVCFVFVGKLEPKKRPLDFIEGLRIARERGADVCGLVVGSGELLDAARERAETLKVPVAFSGFLNQSEITRAYVAADVLVLPSDYGETWGLVVNEAMATGLPVIVSDRVGSAHDLVVDGETGLVFPFGDQTALAEAISRLATDADSRDGMGSAAQKRVLTEYSIERAVEGTRRAISVALRSQHHDHV